MSAVWFCALSDARKRVIWLVRPMLLIGSDTLSVACMTGYGVPSYRYAGRYMSHAVGNHPKPVMYMSKPFPVNAIPVGLAGLSRLTPIPNAESCDWMSRAMLSHVASVDWALSRVRVSCVPLDHSHDPPDSLNPAACMRDVALLMLWVYGLSVASQALLQMAPA